MLRPDSRGPVLPFQSVLPPNRFFLNRWMARDGREGEYEQSTILAGKYGDTIIDIPYFIHKN